MNGILIDSVLGHVRVTVVTSVVCTAWQIVGTMGTDMLQLEAMMLVNVGEIQVTVATGRVERVDLRCSL